MSLSLRLSRGISTRTTRRIEIKLPPSLYLVFVVLIVVDSIIKNGVGSPLLNDDPPNARMLSPPTSSHIIIIITIGAVGRPEDLVRLEYH